MGETGEWLEQHGAPGMTYCLRGCVYVNGRCDDCREFAASQGYDAAMCGEFEDEEDHHPSEHLLDGFAWVIARVLGLLPKATRERVLDTLFPA